MAKWSIMLALLLAAVTAVVFLSRSGTHREYLGEQFADLDELRALAKDDGSNEWPDKAKKRIAGSRIRSDLHAVIIAVMMKQVNKRVETYTVDELKGKLREGVVNQCEQITNTMKHKPELLLKLLEVKENREVILKVISTSTVEVDDFFREYLELFDKNEFDELIELVRFAKKGATDSSFSFSSRMATIIFATFAPPPSSLVGILRK